MIFDILVARAIRNASIRANRFAIETPIFIAHQADSPESLEFRFERIVPLSLAFLSESVLDQNGPKWSKRPFWSKLPYSELDFSIRETKMDQNGPFWSILVHLGLKRSILVHLGPPTALWPFLTSWTPNNRNEGTFAKTTLLQNRPFVLLLREQLGGGPRDRKDIWA